MKKILLISSGLGPGGKERQLIELAKNINRNEYIIGIITFNKKNHYSQQAVQYSSFFRELNKRPSRLEPLVSIWKCFREFKPDIVHTWDALSSFYSYLPCKYFKVKIINGSIRDAGIDKGWKYIFRKFFIKKADVVIANSFAGLKAYNAKGRVIYNSIDPGRFKPVKKSLEFNMIMTANFTDYKDHPTFIRASAKLIKESTVNEVYLLGEGKYRTRYQKWINSEYPDLSKHFHFPGAINNVEEYLAECKIGVLCSTPKYSEGLSNSVLEYMAAGLVPIVTDIGGSSEIIENSKNGFLISPYDFKSIVELVQLVKKDKDLLHKLVNNARDTISEKFLMKKNLKLTEELYKNLILNFN